MRAKARRRQARGLSLIELLLSMALGLVILGAGIVLFRQGVDVSYTAGQRAEMQQNSRVAMNLLARDLSIAGMRVPPGGIELPNGGGATETRRACSGAGSCGILGFFVNDRLYAITPGDGLGPTINGVATDAVTLVFVDDSLRLENPVVSATPSGNQITVDPADVARLNDPATGVQPGDILLISNVNGPALGVVTGLPSPDTLLFDNSDPLNANQPSAANGNIASILDPPNGPAIPNPTNIMRISVISYFIDDSNPNEPVLMRQLNAHPAVPVALNIENLQITYDIADVGAGPEANLPDPQVLVPPVSPDQIREVNIVLGARSPVRGMFGRDFERVTLTTAVSIRNLGWFDRYPGT
jgi:hypothetical protein